MSLRSFRLSGAEIAATPGEVPSLDGLRAISILIVLIGHFALPEAVSGVSATGVVVFFFISGFLISRLLFLEYKRAGRVSLLRFYIRRAARLYPVLIVYLLLVSMVVLHRTGTVSPLSISAALFYFSNYLLSWYNLHGSPLPLPIGGLWSLAVEEHFYIIMPITAVVFRMQAVPIMRAALIVCIGCLVIRAGELLIWPQLAGTLVLYRHSETRFDAIAVGVLMAAMAETESGRRILLRLATPNWLFVGLAGFCASYLLRNDFARQVFRYSLQEAMLFPIFCTVLYGQLAFFQTLLNTSLPRLVGRLSYSLYVWQGGAKFLAAGWLVFLPWVEAPWALLIITVTMATFSFYAVERPALLLRNRCMNRKVRLVTIDQVELPNLA